MNQSNRVIAPASLMQAAAEVAQLAANTAMRWYRDRVDVETKGDGSPVTIADREAERAARAWLSERFPEDGLFGEEFPNEREDAKRRWILDPIDGTKASCVVCRCGAHWWPVVKATRCSPAQRVLSGRAGAHRRGTR